MTDPDDAFLKYGFAKPPADDRLRSSPPDRFVLVNFAFRLRDLLGVSARAEIVRFLLTSRARGATVLSVAEAASYAKRNVAEALGQLARSSDWPPPGCGSPREGSRPTIGRASSRRSKPPSASWKRGSSPTYRLDIGSRACPEEWYFLAGAGPARWLHVVVLFSEKRAA